MGRPSGLNPPYKQDTGYSMVKESVVKFEGFKTQLSVVLSSGAVQLGNKSFAASLFVVKYST